MLALAGALGALSFVSGLAHYHLGHGSIPFWVPLAIDAGIAGACGLLLTFGNAWVIDDGPTTGSDHVFVARSVWNDLQREIVAARGSEVHPAPNLPPIPPAGASAPPPLSPSVAGAAPPSEPPVAPPWDEGPPTAPEPVPASPVAPAPAVQPPVPAPAAPSPLPAAEPELSPAELEEIARMGGILGVVPRPGESGRSFSGRLAEAREALAGGPVPPAAEAPTVPPKAAGPPEWSEAEPASKVSSDIDELMVWLEKMVAEPPGGPVVPPGKKPAAKSSADEPASGNPPA